MAWLTIARMVAVNRGYRSPENTNKTAFNKNASPQQLDRNEYVERVRRILLHFVAYLTARSHEVRARCFTPGSLILYFMAGRTLLAAIGW